MLQDVISILGIANPQLSYTWQDGDKPLEESDSPLTLKSNATDGEWLAPAAGLLNKAFNVRISMGDGNLPEETTWVIKLQPQVYSRLTRLYSRVLEGKTARTDQPQRPVPLYFAYHDTADIGDGPTTGNVDPGGHLAIKGGKISIHDAAGQLIDPLSVASAFVAIAEKFQAIISKDFASTTPPVVSNTQLSLLINSLTAEVRVRLVSLFRNPFTDGATQFNNLDAIKNAEGVYKIQNNEQPITVTDPQGINKKMEIGPATFGTLANSFTPQALASGVTMKRDFLTVFADDINVHLRGTDTLEAPFAGPDFQVPVFHDETLNFFINGNQLLAAEEQVIRNAANFSLTVSPVINSDFSVAADPAISEWPVFPAGGDGTIAGRLQNVQLSAHFLIAPADQRDVFLQMVVPETVPGTPQLASGTAVRVYNRKFLADAREGRGNGAGSVLNAQFSTGFIITNPFGLRKEEALPVRPKLLFDLVAVNRTGGKRSFGLLGTVVSAPADLSASERTLSDKGTNQFGTATEQSTAPAGLLGLPTQGLDTLPVITDVASAVDVALSLGNENQPRVAPRLPLMTRNENITSGRNAAGDWNSVVSGMWLRSDSRSSLHRAGSPGSPGGEEFLGMGFGTSGGLLAYQVARAALRRTRNLGVRLQELDSDTRWAVPIPVPTGNFSAAVLQDIAPGADSAALKLIPDQVFDQMPSDWSSLVNSVASFIPSQPASNVQVRNAITSLANSAKGDFLYSEFRHDALTAKHGRRDSIPVLRSAIQSARDLIYIETSAFSFTDYIPNDTSDPENANDPPGEETDLVSLLAEQLAEKKGIRILIAVSKEVTVGKGYESFAARAYDRRIKAFNALKEGTEDRVQIFHPIGFPGRPIRLMHTLVIVDDMWLFGGSGSFNRRGFMFDGNLSLVCFNREIEAGRSKAIRNFRRRLMENHLGTKPLPGSTPPPFVHPNEARLADLQEAYFAVAEMLEQGGAGFIEKLFDGKVTGQEPIPAGSYPHRDLADPDGINFTSSLALLLQVFIGLGEADA
ncbi:MAG: hypothetical protein ABI707_06970 [Ferruginibacter sp.]